MQRSSVILLGLALAACSTSNSFVGMEQLNQEYGGHRVNDFFANYGHPTGKPGTAPDGMVYHWVSIEPVMDAPLSAGFRGNPSIVVAEASGPAERYCEIDIHTDSKGIIRNFTLLSDSEGKYSISYCSELFPVSKPYKGS